MFLVPFQTVSLDVLFSWLPVLFCSSDAFIVNKIFPASVNSSPSNSPEKMNKKDITFIKHVFCHEDECVSSLWLEAPLWLPDTNLRSKVFSMWMNPGCPQRPFFVIWDTADPMAQSAEEVLWCSEVVGSSLKSERKDEYLITSLPLFKVVSSNPGGFTQLFCG